MSMTLTAKILLAAAASSVLAFGATAAAAQEFNLRFAHENAPTHPVGKGAECLATRVGELTNGRVKVTVVHGGAMGGGAAVLEAVQLGTLEMGTATMGTMSNVVPEFDIVSLPFLFDGYLHLRQVFNGPLRTVLSDAARKKGFEIMAMTTSGARNPYGTKPIKTATDAKGLKIRVMDVPILVETWKALGAQPTPISFQEVYMALQTGVVDAAESSLLSWDKSSLYEVAKYGMRMNYADSGRVYVLNEAVAKKMPEDLLLALKLAWLEAEEHIYTDYILGDEQAVAAAVKKGATLIHPDLDSFRKVLAPVYEKFKPTLGQEWIDRIRATK